MAEPGTRVARLGSVVFAPTYRSDITTEQGSFDTVSDPECGDRFTRSAASRYGGQWVVVADDPAGEQTVQVIHDAIAARQHAGTGG